MSGMCCLAVTFTGEASATPLESKEYRPDVEFFVEVSEAEVAEAVLDEVLSLPKGKQLLQGMRLIERSVLTGEWQRHDKGWEIFGWTAAAAASKEIGKPYPKLARLWMGLENARLLLIAYRLQETDPSKVQPITAELRRGAGVVAGLQNQLVQQESWNSVDDETIQTYIVGCKVRAYGKRPSVVENKLLTPKVRQASSMTPQAASSLALTIGTVIGIVGATVFYHAWKAGPPAFRAAVLSFVLPGGGHRTGVVGVLFFVGAVVGYGLLQSLGVVVALCAARHAATIAGSTSTPAPSVSRALVVFAGVLLALLLAVGLAQSMGLPVPDNRIGQHLGNGLGRMVVGGVGAGVGAALSSVIPGGRPVAGAAGGGFGIALLMASGEMYLILRG
jgi:hypothetical protein